MRQFFFLGHPVLYPLPLQIKCQFFFYETFCTTAFFLSSPVPSVEGPVLRLYRVSRLDMGAYMCIARNGVPPAVSKRIHLGIDCERRKLTPSYRVSLKEVAVGTLELIIKRLLCCKKLPCICGIEYCVLLICLNSSVLNISGN